MSDGSQQGIEAERALETILGGEPAPTENEERTPAFWLERLTKKNDDIDGYEKHAEVIAKYIIEAYRQFPGLLHAPNSPVYMWEVPDVEQGTDWTVLLPDLSDCLKKVYPDESHPYRRAIAEATGFSWGWAFNIARYALGLPSQPNPAIVTIATEGVS